MQLRNANILRASLLLRTFLWGITRVIRHFRPKRHRKDSDSHFWWLRKIRKRSNEAPLLLFLFFCSESLCLSSISSSFGSFSSLKLFAGFSYVALENSIPRLYTWEMVHHSLGWQRKNNSTQHNTVYLQYIFICIYIHIYLPLALWFLESQNRHQMEKVRYLG